MLHGLGWLYKNPEHSDVYCSLEPSSGIRIDSKNLHGYPPSFRIPLHFGLQYVQTNRPTKHCTLFANSLSCALCLSAAVSTINMLVRAFYEFTVLSYESSPVHGMS